MQPTQHILRLIMCMLPETAVHLGTSVMPSQLDYKLLESRAHVLLSSSAALLPDYCFSPHLEDYNRGSRNGCYYWARTKLEATEHKTFTSYWAVIWEVKGQSADHTLWIISSWHESKGLRWEINNWGGDPYWGKQMYHLGAQVTLRKHSWCDLFHQEMILSPRATLAWPSFHFITNL